MLSFGDVFVLNNDDGSTDDYVYFGIIDGIVYAAQILTEHKTNQVVRLRNQKIKQNGTRSIEGQPLFFFVALTTKQFENRIALIANTDSDKSLRRMLLPKDNRLRDEDVEALKNKILDEKTIVPPPLKKHVQGLYDHKHI